MTADCPVPPISNLAERHCVPCRGGVPPLTEEEYQPLLAQLPKWRVVERHHLERTFFFKDFAEALSFVNRIGEIAEQVGHHPDFHLSWGQVKLDIWTHKIDGLSESDFILAAKCDAIGQ